MKYLSFTFLFLLCLLSCDKEATMLTKDYPVVVTDPVTEISSSGAVFSANVKNENNQEIIDFGFILTGEGQEITISLSDSTDIENFRLYCRTNIAAGEAYLVRAYIKTNEYLIKANQVTFLGLGSMAPQVIDFFPKECPDGTKVSIICKYLGYSQASVHVYLNNYKCSIQSIDHDTLVFLTPFSSYIGEAYLSVENVDTTILLSTPITILGPEIQSVSPLIGSSATEIHIHGENLLANGQKLSAFLGQYKLEILEKSNTSVLALAPLVKNLYSECRPISVINGMKTSSTEDQFNMITPWSIKRAQEFFYFYEYDAFSYNGRGYIMELGTQCFYCYDAIYNSWNKLDSSLFPGKVHKNSLYVIDEEVLYMINNAIDASELWTYNFHTNTWTQKDDLPFTFSRASYFSFNGFTYIVTSAAQVWRCDLQTGNYSRLNDLPSTYKYFSLPFIIDGKVHLTTYSNTYIYDEQNDKWSFLENNTFKKSINWKHSLGFVLNNTAYVLEGGSDLYKYFPEYHKWFMVAKYPRSADSYKVIFTIGDYAYIAATSSHYADNAPFLFSYCER